MSDLFSRNLASIPLAERMRPQSLDEFVGQTHLTAKDRLLHNLLQNKTIPSLILWGPPGTGKTTLAKILASSLNFYFVSISATSAGVIEVRQVIAEARERIKAYGQQTILFVDEIHRFNKAQQDVLLAPVEQGTVTLIGTTTENPSFEVIAPLLSRSRVLVLQSLSEKELISLLNRALRDPERGLGSLSVTTDKKALSLLAQISNGDARFALNTLEVAATLSQSERSKTLTAKHIETALQKEILRYDRAGEEHYNTISAFIKSMRGSDPNAALYYLARMLEAGEEPLFIARRMVIFASEDIGNARPYAITLAISVMQAVQLIGLPEAQINLAQGATYLATAPKSNASYIGIEKAIADVKAFGNLPIPLHLRNAPTKLMRGLGYGKGYRYPHNEPGNVAYGEQYLPDKLKDKVYYRPKDPIDEG